MSKFVIVKCTPTEHQTLHQYVETVLGYRKVGALVRIHPINTLLGRASRFNARTFDTPEDFQEAVDAERKWLTAKVIKV